jgi:tRNA-dihydrouridine synthase A
MDHTDRHCRYFHRLLTRRARLYTEMVTTGALLHGDVARHLDFNEEEHPVALQLGGSEPAELAQCARLAENWGYDEVNLNCGCPSERVQRGSFGACLMAEPRLVADCVKAMCDAVALPVTVKHRIGIDRTLSYAFVRDFVGTVAQAGCSVFIVHARNAWLKGLSPRAQDALGPSPAMGPSAVDAPTRGLSPKENREVPPLRYDFVYRLKHDFPSLTIVLNGGVTSNEQIAGYLEQVDGVMLGRAAYHDPWMMSEWDTRFFGDALRGADRDSVEIEMVSYMERRLAAAGTSWPHVARHMMGLRNAMSGARRWRRIWSDSRRRDQSPRCVMVDARAAATLAAVAPG